MSESATKGQTLSQKGPTVHVTDVVHHGEQLIIPSLMSLDDAINLLERRKKYMQEEVAIDRVFNVFPWDGAHAFDKVLTKKYGWSPAEATPTMFGPEPPQMINIDISHDAVAAVPWGRFTLPGIRGFVHTDAERKDGRWQFKLSARVKRVNEDEIRQLFEAVQSYLNDGGSIYHGKAIKLRFRDDDGNVLSMPEPKFIRTDDISRADLIYSQAVTDAIETNLFTPISRIHDCVANGIQVKRGVLLGGPYGTGKTLAAKVASRLSNEAGITFVYVSRADELGDAIKFVQPYAKPAVTLFCEDIDRAVNGERSVAMDDILNVLDGLDTKSMNLITVLTTNHLENINPAMLRPGRLDSIIEVTPPDARAVERLIRLYGGAAISADTDLTSAGQSLAGQIPAVIAEVVKRAKLSQLRLQPAGEPVRNISSEALAEAAATMSMQVELLKRATEPKQAAVSLDNVLGALIERHANGSTELKGNLKLNNGMSGTVGLKSVQ